MTRPFTLKATEKIAAAGSCFAQNISRYLMARYRKNYLVSEPAAEGEPTFSGRYGNIYTCHQLLQLMQEVEQGIADPNCALKRRDGRYVDCYRPFIQKDGYETPDDVRAARDRHLARVSELLSNLDVFVFTLGMTEAWRVPDTGRTLPNCPGIYSDVGQYEFHNYSAAETTAAMHSALAWLRKMNPTVKVILSVSPVPLTATFSDEHVAVANSFSKSVLRVCCAEMEASHSFVHYFPAYEMITNSFTQNCFFEDGNRRTVRPEIVDQVMQHFDKTVLKNLSSRNKPVLASAGENPGDDDICDDLELMKDLDF
ncbi:GSCFA domain-containing protein [Halocynthiibacter styelae]|uniref:GSCFA domain-containing protein n=1 Tax=Halocynthiibacter styelae TaxID=2761955 RepID=A0A8J7J863_9RHOB|nr:GSCFA domain-containing protein [Paenihalocynthiibacter styelae]MBI1495075.1 GSCFA domain-containing protein [Paenihalocynthiibacter styelae]